MDFADRTAMVRFRRGDGWKVKPEAESLDGAVVEVSFGWAIGPDDSGIYVGEDAYILSPGTPLSWIASGDLEFLSPNNIEGNKSVG